MIKLEELNACNDSGINQNGIRDVTWLIKLDVSNNTKITDVNHMTKLEELGACYNWENRGDGGLDQNGIKNVTSLRILNVWENKSITDVNHMTKLEELNAGGSCGIDQNGLYGATSLRILDIINNRKIKNINHLTKLKKLYVDIENEMDEIKNIDQISVSNVNFD